MSATTQEPSVDRSEQYKAALNKFLDERGEIRTILERVGEQPTHRDVLLGFARDTLSHTMFKDSAALIVKKLEERGWIIFSDRPMGFFLTDAGRAEISATLRRLVTDGWNFFRDPEDGKWYGEIDDGNGYTRTEAQSSKADAVQAALRLLEVPLDDDERDPNWFRAVEVPGDGRRVEQLLDHELRKGIGIFRDSNPTLAEAMHLMLAANEADWQAAQTVEQPAAPAQAPPQELVQIERAAPVAAQGALFDYSALDEADRQFVRASAGRIASLVKQTAENVWHIGQELIGIRARLKGRYIDFLNSSEFPFGERFARQCVSVAQILQLEDLSNLAPSVAYQLASESTPEAARLEVLERARSGEVFTKTSVKTVITEHRQVIEERTPRQSEMFDERPASGAGDTADITHLPEVEQVAAGRTEDDLVSMLKATPGGMSAKDLVGMGFSDKVIDAAHVARRIELYTETYKYGYPWKPEDVVAAIREHGAQTLVQLEALGFSHSVVNDAESRRLIVRNGKLYALAAAMAESAKPAEAAAKLAPPTIEEMLGERPLVVTYTYLPILKGKVTVGVRVGDDPTTVAIESLDSSAVRHTNPRVLEMIAERIEKAKQEKPATKAAAKKPAAKSPTKPAAKKLSATKAGAGAKKQPASATKAGTGAKKQPVSAKSKTAPPPKKKSKK